MPDDRICGANAVAALFARRAESVVRLFYAEDAKADAGPHCAVMAAMLRPYRLLPPDELERAAGTPHHGGLCAVATSKPIGMMDFVRPPRHPLLLVLDSVGNPHNLGAIARSAAFFGVQALVLQGVGHGADQALARGGWCRHPLTL